MSGTLVPAQQRRAMRRAVRVECQVVRERGFALVGTQAVDLSPSGMLVVAEGRVLTGDPVVVAFRLPHTSWWFDAEATVARVIHGRRPGDAGLGFGIEFESLDPAVNYFVHTLLQGVAPPVPKRRPRIDYAASVERAVLS